MSNRKSLNLTLLVTYGAMVTTALIDKKKKKYRKWWLAKYYGKNIVIE